MPDSTNGTDENQSSPTEMRTCEGCCGATSQRPADQPCPVVDCAPCGITEPSNLKSTATTIARSLLIGVVIVAALVLVFSGKKSGAQEDKLDEIDWSDQEN